MNHPVEAEAFLGFGPHAWVAIGTMILAVVTALVAAVGLFQLTAARDVVTLLNYLESIAIGIQEGAYDEELAKKTHETRGFTVLREISGASSPRRWELDPANYIPLRDLYAKWLRT